MRCVSINMALLTELDVTVVENSRLDFEFRRLGHEFDWVPVDHLVDLVFGVAAFSHFQGGAGDCEGNADAPIARAVHPDLVHAVQVENVDRARGRAFGFGIERHTRPEAGVFDSFDGVFFDVIDDAAFWFDTPIVF